MAFSWSDPGAVEVEMRACYDAALARNFITTALDISIYLSMIYRFRGKEAASVELLSSLLPIVRGVSTSRTKAVFLIAFANVLSERRQSETALDVLVEAAQATLPDQPALEAQLRLTAARVRLAGGADMEVVDTADEAARLFLRLNRPGLVGVSLHVKSKAWLGMNRVGEAVRAARCSVEALSGGHPMALRRAQNTLYRLTGSGSTAARSVGVTRKRSR
jgi:hypothetical protein